MRNLQGHHLLHVQNGFNFHQCVYIIANRKWHMSIFSFCYSWNNTARQTNRSIVSLELNSFFSLSLFFSFFFSLSLFPWFSSAAVDCGYKIELFNMKKNCFFWRIVFSIIIDHIDMCTSDSFGLFLDALVIGWFSRHYFRAGCVFLERIKLHLKGR